MGGHFDLDEKSQKIKELTKELNDENKLVILDGVLDLGRFERDDMIVPQRNAFLIMLAAMYGETLYLASISGDRARDKCPEFFEKKSKVISLPTNDMTMEVEDSSTYTAKDGKKKILRQNLNGLF